MKRGISTTAAVSLLGALLWALSACGSTATSSNGSGGAGGVGATGAGGIGGGSCAMPPASVSCRDVGGAMMGMMGMMGMMSTMAPALTFCLESGDPNGAAALTQSCAAEMGSLDSSPCPSVGLIGSCVLSSRGITFASRYYGPPDAAGALETACGMQHGSFCPLM